MCLKPSIDGLTHPVCKKKYGLDGLISVVEYKGVVKKLIYQLKYKPNLYALSELIGSIMYEGLIQNEVFMHITQQDILFTSIPLHSSRERKRGYNHAQLLAKHISMKLDLSHKELLKRIKNTQPQFKLSKEERILNIKDAFAVDAMYKNVINGKTVFVVDDIATTCTTLKECAKVLKRSGVKNVYGLTFAKER